ncbi:hypothetical protein GECvBGOT_gp092 [Salmonella phage GEC_vB_GOT]|nr:hypothetical protein GECvBGOT_gp092 [Salmonella phage GEC_vB_GOT]
MISPSIRRTYKSSSNNSIQTPRPWSLTSKSLPHLPGRPM